MIFVTVGTHEQQFDRLIRKIDDLKKQGKIKEDVFIQLGYSNYIPEKCKWKKMIGYEEMNKYMSSARIIITHGGPGSIFQSINYDKIPVVVARNPEFSEHVDEHQMEFARKLDNKKKVIAIENVEELENVIDNYESIVAEMKTDGNSNVGCFIQQFSLLVRSMMCG